MAAKALILLAPGFEDLEAIATVDILRRAEVDLTVASLHEDSATGSRGTTVVTDTNLTLLGDEARFDAVILPGGQPGTNNLAADRRVIERVQAQSRQGGLLAAICAAPKVLAVAGLLEGRRFTHYPGALTEQEAAGSEPVNDAVVVDGNIVTGRGPGVAIDFALAVVEQLVDRETRDRVESALAR